MMTPIKRVFIFLFLILFGAISAGYLASSFGKKAHAQQDSNTSGAVIPAEMLKAASKADGRATEVKQKSNSGKVDSQKTESQKNDSQKAEPANPAVEKITGQEIISTPTLSLPQDDFVYDPNGKRDPFRPFFKKRVKIEVPTSDDQLEPLQRFALAQLKVVAIIWEVKNPRAIIRDPNGGTHMVAKSSRVGNNKGYVSMIREGELVIIETVQTEDGNRKEVQILSLKK